MIVLENAGRRVPEGMRWGAAYSRARPNAQRRHKDRFMCDRYEIERCKVWLELERAIVKPAVVVALGGTAARSLLGRAVTITKLRRHF
jgi:uracil-DNA glycosylase family 4